MLSLEIWLHNLNAYTLITMRECMETTACWWKCPFTSQDIYTEICPWKSPVCTMVSLARLHVPPPPTKKPVLHVPYVGRNKFLFHVVQDPCGHWLFLAHSLQRFNQNSLRRLHGRSEGQLSHKEAEIGCRHHSRMRAGPHLSHQYSISSKIDNTQHTGHNDESS